jgi:hypothetical protein
MFNNRARSLKVGLVLLAVVFVAAIFIARISATTTQTAPSSMIITVGPSTTSSPITLPIKTPVSISLSDIGPSQSAAGASLGTGSVTACSGGATWSWIGLNGTGTVARGNSVATVGAIMFLATATGKRVILNSASTIRVVNPTATYVRLYINW